MRSLPRRTWRTPPESKEAVRGLLERACLQTIGWLNQGHRVQGVSLEQLLGLSLAQARARTFSPIGTSPAFAGFHIPPRANRSAFLVLHLFS